MASQNLRTRNAFTLVELVMAVAIVAILGVIVAQLLSFSLLERARVGARQTATELAVNVLEEARAQPFDKLDKVWADARAIPSESVDLLPKGKLITTVEPEKTAHEVKRITVEVRWQFETHVPVQNVRLTTLLSAREAKKKGGTP